MIEVIDKKNSVTPRIAEDIAAFANAKGGVIILGVRDDKTIIGEKLTNELKARITSIAFFLHFLQTTLCGYTTIARSGV